ncbi:MULTISPECIES: DUF302 domain-containing protein [unclassified Nitratiruptor]|uniref:DUF302 domain-containing protein n=1 Tax=unclassified Nitratiruptor TaxID=2624044 RepID=UPI001914FB5A|nr:MULTISPECIES: DUF302 domain-containing protein [unclassified Nitratiruptor]BCD61104.1 hypothetical protein NitYY0810_C1885 [Nitratiruptor sp. YY08-10]BCD65037.1 hypothetical protein NitYY0814_C1894 [Nitratiruptor sp. YY08-14]
MKKIIVLLSFVLTLFANDHIILFATKAKVTPAHIEEVFQKAGYSIQQNRDMNGPYKKQFKQTDFDIYTLMTVYYPKIAMDTVVQYPDSGIFAPYSIVIYKKKGEERTYAGVLSAKAKAHILGTHELDSYFKKLEKLDVETLKKALPGATRVTLNYQPQQVKEKLLTKYSFEVDDEEALDTKDELEMMIEDGLKPIGFVMANFNDFNYDLKEAKINDFIFYDTYSLCKLKVIYNISKVRPEAGVFAPCTMAVYQKRGTNTMNIVFPNIYNWIATLSLKDPKLIKILEKAQKDMVNVIENALP